MTGDVAAARGYDAWFDQPWGRYASAVERDALLGSLGPVRGRRVLEVGCGTGRFTSALVAAGANVVGLDRDAGMLAVAGERVTVPLVRGDAHRLPFRDACCDVTLAVTLLEFSDRPNLIIDELVRVTRPGGRVVVAALNPHSPWGLIHRRKLARPPWANACLRTPRQLRRLVAGRGPVTRHAALLAPRPLPGWLTAPVESAVRAAPDAGAFQIMVLTVP